MSLCVCVGLCVPRCVSVFLLEHPYLLAGVLQMALSCRRTDAIPPSCGSSVMAITHCQSHTSGPPPSLYCTLITAGIALASSIRSTDMPCRPSYRLDQHSPPNFSPSSWIFSTAAQEDHDNPDVTILVIHDHKGIIQRTDSLLI